MCLECCRVSDDTHYCCWRGLVQGLLTTLRNMSLLCNGQTSSCHSRIIILKIAKSQITQQEQTTSYLVAAMNSTFFPAFFDAMVRQQTSLVFVCSERSVVLLRHRTTAHLLPCLVLLGNTRENQINMGLRVDIASRRIRNPCIFTFR